MSPLIPEKQSQYAIFIRPFFHRKDAKTAKKNKETFLLKTFAFFAPSR